MIKKIKSISLSLFVLTTLFMNTAFAQAPQSIPYQAVARDINGNLISGQVISLRFSLHDIVANGTVVYSETQSATTNSLGLFSVFIGMGTPISGLFSSINWGVNAKFLQVEMDTSGGVTFVDMGTQQLMSVPYALYSGTSGNLPNGTVSGNTLRWNGSAWVADNLLTNTGTNIGIGNTSPDAAAALEISSTNKGLLLPRMNTLQREAISNPPPGLMIYNTDINCVEVRTVLMWMSFCNGVCSPPSTISTAGSDQVLVVYPVNLQANTPVYGTGNWSVLSGTGGSFINVNNPLTSFNGTGNYVLRWTIKTPCDSSYDDVNLYNSCPTGFADCNNQPADGCEIYLLNDPNNCGLCGTVCNTLMPNAITSCNTGLCTFISCLPGFYNLDGNTSNGCEYACTFTNAIDVPDNSFTDANCDGIDGDVTDAIFVSATTGNNANPGTKALPMLTINAGISAAVSSGKTQVYISSGNYNERVNLTNGISLYGGYSATSNWARSASNIVNITGTLVSGTVIGIQGSSITASTTVNMITVNTINNVSAGGSNYAIHCVSCTGLSITNCNLTAGNGAAGTTGANGNAGSAGNNGNAGSGGHCSNDGPGAAGGTAGTSSCSTSGGSGGIGGGTSGFGSLNGAAGLSGSGGAAGGAGGINGDPGGPGLNGSNGIAGSSGSNGTGGSGGTIVSNLWSSSIGISGNNGTNGNGGGGGGGGGSQTGTFVNDGFGNGGGGGGGGGCLGTSGTGGTGGGGSFGVFVINSNGMLVSNCNITSKNGGNGGSGGTGGNGGTGGTGGIGGLVCTTEVGKGGNGGNGGAGGNGGHGGGGAGGPSYSIYRINSTSVATATNSLITGFGGNGGTSSGAPGSNGASGSMF
jgi:hypothetical protein